MKEVVLISDGNTPLGKALARNFYSTGMKIFATLPKLPAEANSKTEYLEWNRSSAVSAKNCLLHIKKTTPEAVHFYLLPPLLNHLKADISDHRAFEQLVDSILKGSYYFAREAADFLDSSQRGSLSLIHTPAIKEMPVFSRLLSGALAEFYDILLEKWKDRFLIQAFELPIEAEDSAVEFIEKHKDQKSDKSWGKWLRFKKGLRLF
ncbi:MAG: hypothetical protein JXR70_06620 [Spirochaetales bacterium]|nr:hypothetical protein [Spirochaetales bacterium]